MPLAFLVVCVHADFTKKFSYAGKQVNCAYDIGYHIVNFISHTLADIAVPLFYLINLKSATKPSTSFLRVHVLSLLNYQIT